MINLSSLEDAFLFVSSDQPFMHSAIVNKRTGETFYQSELSGMDEFPEDIEGGDFIAILHKNDLDLGKDLVFDFVSSRLPQRLGEVEQIFRARGAYGRFKSLLESVGLKVEFGFATFYVNDAFVETYPDSKTVMADGSVFPTDAKDYSWPRSCVHHPDYRKSRNGVIESCAERFKDHPAIVAWDIHNEPSLRGCYCDNTLAIYRKTLGDEFAGIEDLNRAFDTSFPSFAEVEPPKSPDENKAAWRHWRAFMTAELNRFLREGRDIIKSHVPDGKITYNPTDPFHIGLSAQDWWDLRNYEFLSMSHYRGSSAATAAEAFKLEIMKALDPAKDVWIAEFQGGPFVFARGEWNMYPGKAMALELNAAFAHGIQSVIFYRWEPLLSGPEPWINGMIEVDDYDTERRLTLKEGIAELKEYQDILDNGKSRVARVGIFLRRDHIIYANENSLDIDREMTGIYALLSDSRYEVDAVLDEFDPKCDYEAMVFPYTHIDEDLSIKVKEYAAAGGKAMFVLPTSDAGVAAKIA